MALVEASELREVEDEALLHPLLLVVGDGGFLLVLVGASVVLVLVLVEGGGTDDARDINVGLGVGRWVGVGVGPGVVLSLPERRGARRTGGGRRTGCGERQSRGSECGVKSKEAKADAKPVSVVVDPAPKWRYGSVKARVGGCNRAMATETRHERTRDVVRWKQE